MSYLIKGSLHIARTYTKQNLSLGAPYFDKDVYFICISNVNRCVYSKVAVANNDNIGFIHLIWVWYIKTKPSRTFLHSNRRILSLLTPTNYADVDGIGTKG